MKPAWSAAARSAADALLAALLSPRCAVCDRLNEHATRGAACEPCWAAIPFITPPYCDRCGEPLAARTPGPGSCAECVGREPAVDRSRGLGAYDGPLRALVHVLKYDGRRSVAPRLAALMRQRCGSLLAGADALVPVPLHPRRQWTRGFNQAEELARHLRLPVWRALRRTRHTVPQSELAAADRWTNVRGAFAVRRGRPPLRASHLRGARLVLIDDVSTTGATLEACAEALKGAGAVEVRALVVARAVRRIKG